MNCGLRQKDSAFFSINLLITGFVSSSLQLLLMREIMNISGGLELIAGTFLASWLIGSATGAILAGKWEKADLRKVAHIFSITPIISITCLILLTRLFLHLGETPSFLISLIFTFVIIFPFCFISGFIFVRLTTEAGKLAGLNAGRSFATETFGGIIAGIVITLLTDGLLDTYQLILIVILLNLAFVFIVFYKTGRLQWLLTSVAFLLLSTAIILTHPDTFFRQLLLPGLNVISSIDTPYGNISVSENSGQKSLFYNQRLVYYGNDEAEREEDIHYAMLQHNKPGSVLLISGGLKSHLPEILKYNVKRVIYIERDPSLISAEGLDETVKTNSGITIENDDAYRFIRNNDEKFDVIILLIPPPSTLSLNRYYTTDFFKVIKKRLNPDGVFMISSGQSSVYLNKVSLSYNSTIYNSLKSVFINVVPIMGNKLYLLTSDNLLSTSICRLVNEKGIHNIYVNENYLSDDLIKNKSDELISAIEPTAKQNSLVRPISYFQYMTFNLSMEKNNHPAIIILISLLFVLPVTVIKRENLVMYFSASALAGIEIIALMLIQLTIGNLYHITGLILSSVMAGLAAGTGFSLKNLVQKSVNFISAVLILFYVFFGMIINRILLLEQPVIIILLTILLSFIPAFLTGRLFRSLSNDISISNNIGEIYSADLAGSAFGFVIVSGLLLSVLGIQLTIFIFAGFIIAGLISLTQRIKN